MKLNFTKRTIVAVSAVGGVPLLLVVGLLVKNSAINERNVQESGLNSMYLTAQNELSSCLDKSKQAANITKAQAATMTDALTDVIKGRYSESSTAKPTSGAMFSAIVEDYPDMKPYADAFASAYSVIIGCREDYKNVQNQLLSRLASYEAWRTGSLTARTFANAPSDQLQARIGTQKVIGQEALDQMFLIVIVKDTIEAYESGVLEQEDLFQDTGRN